MEGKRMAELILAIIKGQSGGMSPRAADSFSELPGWSGFSGYLLFWQYDFSSN
jgi:hypothetical protein